MENTENTENMENMENTENTKTTPSAMTIEGKKRIARKIRRYNQQNMFTENEIGVIDRFFQMDTSDNPKQTSENESGLLLVLNDFSDDTLTKVQNFVKECEQNWTKQRKQMRESQYQRTNQQMSK